MEVLDKLQILTDAAKYDAACTSSGVDRKGDKSGIGSAVGCGICHSFSADGRCISLLKVLMTNQCMYDCQYCVNRTSNDVPRTTFTPQELADLTISFYRRNYIEGLFLSSGVLKSPDYTMELMYNAIWILRNEYRFRGYIHVKTIPGTSDEIVTKMGLIVDRMSVNIELPSESSLNLLAPNKSKSAILAPMTHIRDTLVENKRDLVLYSNAPKFSPGGQATQMIIGATPDTDFQIMRLSESLYKKYSLKRVFYSAFQPAPAPALAKSLMALPTSHANSAVPADFSGGSLSAPLLREHRLYQTDWLIRFYGFTASEILSEEKPHLDPLLDPKCNWAMNNLGEFPIEVNTAPREMLLRVPGIGVNGADKIIAARRLGSLDFDMLKKMRIVLKRAVYFITCNGRTYEHVNMNENNIYSSLISHTSLAQLQSVEQISLFNAPVTRDDLLMAVTGQM